MVATANCGTLMGPISLVHVPNHYIANDLAIGTTGHVDGFDPFGLHNRSRPVLVTFVG